MTAIRCANQTKARAAAHNSAQPFTGPQWGFVRPFGLQASDGNATTGVYFDPGTPPQMPAQRDQFVGNFTLVALFSSLLDPAQDVTWSASPANATLGANNPPPDAQPTTCNIERGTPFCTNRGAGHDFNPVTGQPYAPNPVARGDYARVLAEFWADGPDSEVRGSRRQRVRS